MIALTKTLRFRLTAVFAAVITATTALMALAVDRLGRADLYRLHARTGEVVARHVGDRAAAALAAGDIAEVRRLVESLRHEPFVRYAELRDGANRPIGRFSPIGVDLPAAADAPGQREIDLAGERLSEVSVPIRTDEATLGDLRVGLTLAPLLDREAEAARKIGALLLVAVALGAFAAYLLVRSALRPIGELVAAMRRMQDGDLAGLPTDRYDNEIGTLQRALNKLAVTLRTARKQLLDANVDLEREVEKRTAELQLALDELKVVDRMKDDFLSSVSHEFRTPLTSIRAYAEILRHFEGEDPDTRREFLDIILTESDRLTGLVGDALELARIEAGDLDWSLGNVDVVALAEDTLSSLRPSLEQHQLRSKLFRDETVPHVRADRSRVAQVMTHLLSNAIKFSREGSTVELSVRSRGDQVDVDVRDYGPGIDPDDQRRIFDRFQQLGDTLTEKPRGTGLGLPICRNIVERHGGEIWVESLPGEGSHFHFTLPIAGPTARLESVRAAEYA